MNFLTKLIFLLRKPPVIIVVGRGKDTAAEAIFKVLGASFKVKKINKKPNLFDILEGDVLVWPIERKKLNTTSFFIKDSKKPVLVVTNVGEIPFKEEFFSGERLKTIQVRKSARALPLNGKLILNFDDETVREIEDEVQVSSLTFGFQEGADFLATDIKETCGESACPEDIRRAESSEGTNFKINYDGKIVPFWLKNLFGKEQVYAVLSATACGVVFGLNLVDISQSLKNYFSIPGKQRLIGGIKNSLILDDSENASLLSMMEALDILGRIKNEKRTIVVLGDILGIGKYSIEAHETIGEKVAMVADILFTVGARARFITQGAIMKNFPKENIFQFDEVEKAIKTLQEKIKEGDLVLIDGSKELKMEKIVEEIKQF